MPTLYFKYFCSKCHAHTLLSPHANLQTSYQYIVIFWSAGWVQYQYAIHVVCCTAVPTAHYLHLYCLFQCTFTRHTADFSFPSPADA